MKKKESYKTHKKWEQWKIDGGERTKLIKVVQMTEQHAKDLNAQTANNNIEYVAIVEKKGGRPKKEETKTEE